MANTTVLLVQVTDADCSDAECWVHRLPLNTDKMAIMSAIQTLYPTTSSVWIGVEEDKEDIRDI